MAEKLLPDARLTAEGIVDFQTGELLPNYVGTVYARLVGRDYILFRSVNGDMSGDAWKWDVINAGSHIVKSALSAFIALNFSTEVVK